MKKPAAKSRDLVIPILIFLIFVGAVLRLYHLDFNSFWLDEAATYIHSDGSLSHVWNYMVITGDYNPPFFFILESIMISLFGKSEWWLRFIPAIFGIATIPVMYYAGKEFYDKYTGLIAAGIITFSPFLIYYSQEARPYSMLLFFCAVTFYYYLVAMKRNTLIDWAYVAIGCAAIFYTQFYGLIFVAALGIFALASMRKNIIPLLQSSCIFAIISAPLLLATYTLYLQRTATAPTYGLQGMQLLTNTIFHLSGLIGVDVFVAVYLITFAIGIVGLSILTTREKPALLLWIFAFTLLVGLFMASKVPTMPRYMIFLMIPFSLGIGAAYDPIKKALPDSTRRIAIAVSIILVFAFMSVLFYQSYYSVHSKENWREVSTGLYWLTGHGDVVVPVPSYNDLPLNFYYSAASDGTSEISFNDSKISKSRVWYILTPDVYAADPSGETLRWLQENTKPVAQYGSIYISVKNNV